MGGAHCAIAGMKAWIDDSIAYHRADTRTDTDGWQPDDEPCPICGGHSFSDSDGSCDACGWWPRETAEVSA